MDQARGKVIGETQTCSGLVFPLSMVTCSHGHPSHHKILRGSTLKRIQQTVCKGLRSLGENGRDKAMGLSRTQMET